MATVLIDCVLHHCHVVKIRGNSYRLREHSKVCNFQPPQVRNF
jgi:hypothetical protein